MSPFSRELLVPDGCSDGHLAILLSRAVGHLRIGLPITDLNKDLKKQPREEALYVVSYKNCTTATGFFMVVCCGLVSNVPGLNLLTKIQH